MTMKQPAVRGDIVMLNAYVPQDLLDRVDRHVERLRQDEPHRSISRSSTVRELLDIGLRERERKR